MNKLILLSALLILCLLPVLILAQENETIIKKGNKTIIINKEGDISGLEGLKDLQNLKKLKMEMDVDVPRLEAADAPFFGIYPADLDFPKAQSLGYPNSYGVLITGIVPNSPAYEYRLAEDDIIMEIDGKKALNLKEFDKLKSVYRAGDKVVLTIFRNGEVKNIDFFFGSRVPPQIPGTPGTPEMPRKLSPGGGGLGWVPTFYGIEVDDVNAMLDSLSFSNLPEDGVLALLGFAGKGNVGKGWFLGGQFHTFADFKKKNAPETGYINIMDYDFTTWGITLDKCFPITRGLITSLGAAVGGAYHTMNLVHTNGDFNWGVPPENNYSVTLKKSYAMVQPRAELQVKLLSWLGLRGEVGYIYGYSPKKGWKQTYSETEVYEVDNSPDTPVEGLIFSVGPWIGF